MKVAFHDIPLLEMELRVVICDSVIAARNSSRFSKLFRSKWERKSDVKGMCSTDCFKGLYLFFSRKHLDHSLIAHEVFHAVQFICEKHGVRVSSDGGEEAPALFCEYLTELVYGDLKKWKISIRS